MMHTFRFFALAQEARSNSSGRVAVCGYPARRGIELRYVACGETPRGVICGVRFGGSPGLYPTGIPCTFTPTGVNERCTAVAPPMVHGTPTPVGVTERRTMPTG